MSEPWNGPLVIDARSDSQQTLRSISGTMDALLATHGAILLRGFGIYSAEAFQDFIGMINVQQLDYNYRSTPRTKVIGKIMTASEYPPQLEIPLHCENAYQRSWPHWLTFCCVRPAAKQGQTTLADLSRVTENLGDEIVRTFERLGVKYIRHYRPYVDLSWQEVFQTDSKLDLEHICQERSIQFEWLDAETLRTVQVSQGVISHPLTHQRLFFNQAHLFHASSLGKEALEALETVFGRDRLPRTARFGDDAEIPIETLSMIRQAFSQEAWDVDWRAGDVLVLDNMRIAHGRRPFEGERSVLTALLESTQSSVWEPASTPDFARAPI